ncbi:DUF2851 family protein [Marinoscillum pacificum]|uniref:DUF2851 family protein n=1 Tax=Marinoscillum pacificum TaxID=392723 RepID=UPI0021573456|nr:DUF2851 family protein [Marinoscillum pacificum]
MDEYFLQYIWNFQKFNSNELSLTNGSVMNVFVPGYQNSDSGPDFKEAKIKIDDLTWSGSVEVHFKSSDWYKHNHQEDRAYENVILHVVWKHDQEVLINGNPIPTLELMSYVLENVELAYKHYINQPSTIRCSDQIGEIAELQIISMIDKALSDRLKVKSKAILEMLDQNNGDWEETAYQLLLKNFGFKINQEAFQTLSKSLPYSVIKKYKNKPIAIESLLFGMSGFLESPTDEYSNSLLTEFDYLKSKHNLIPILKKHHWNRSRMRPANFPTVRLAQLSSLLTNKSQLFAQLIELSDHKNAISFFQNSLSTYWEEHYDFSKPTKKPHPIGASAIDNLIINTVVPLIAAYGKYIDEVRYLDQAQAILEKIKPEKNHIIDKWKDAGVKCSNSYESQALIHQYNHWCKEKKCLQCNIGISILSPKLAP